MEQVPVQVVLDEKSTIDAMLLEPKFQSPWNSFCVIMTHGAGGDMNTEPLAKLAKDLSASGLLSLRFTCRTPNFSYRVRCFAAAVKYIKDHEKYNVKGCVIGGRSMGGRVAAELATLQPTDSPFILGVFCYSYPLHRPKQYKELRVSHLIHLNVPVLFISGTKDDMCKMDLMEEVIDKIGSDVKVHWIHDAGHSLKVKSNSDDDILSKICLWTVEWTQSVFTAER